MFKGSTSHKDSVELTHDARKVDCRVHADATLLSDVAAGVADPVAQYQKLPEAIEDT